MKKNIAIKFLKWFTGVSCCMAILSVNTTCSIILHQPKLPATLNKYKK